MTKSVLVTLDGEVHDFDAPLLHADDLAAVRGDGIFDTLLVRGGRPRKVRRHLERFANSAAAMGLDAPDLTAWDKVIDIAAEQWRDAVGDSGPEGLLRLVYSRGRESRPGSVTAYATITELPARIAQARRDGVSVVTLERGYSIDLAANAPWQLLGAKTLSYATNMAALRHATDQGFDDVIFTSAEGAVLEGPRSTVVAVYDKTLVTPPVEIGILPGTTTNAVFELAEQEGWKTETRVLLPADLIAADAVWLVSSVTLAARVTAINRYVMPDDADEHRFADLVDRAISVD
ncbi:aminodeoxychorismate lyase [Gordonia sp. ABSL1-1]|uniref:aminodeoxychorismate lyase n=1 Tax=Gordonia sp. ABSL1-1 TaxID=3053923 RepID=UPI0025747B58|nr:aminodeoxychorismate lyase [Gordonia sp. ABSL1-1]MDL9936167.1 aminodeoxychorismate lyase [Gordonia sp. ABSL1-1]